MVLVINGVVQEEPPPDSRSLFHAHPIFRESAAQLLGIPTKVIGPVGLLYVGQREMAVTVPHDSKYIVIVTFACLSVRGYQSAQTDFDLSVKSCLTWFPNQWKQISS